MVTAELKKLKADLHAASTQLATLNAASLSIGDKGGTMAKNLRAQQTALKEFRMGVEGGAAGFNEIMIASGRYNVETIKTISHTEMLTKKIREQKLTWKEYRKERDKIKGSVADQQAALQNAGAIRWGGSETGKQNYDIYMPKNLNGDLTTTRMRYGMLNEALKSVAQQTINWGKNTQWAGRQITVGIGYPIALLGAAMGRAALQADQQITRIQKVYDTQTVDQFADATVQAAQAERELAGVRVMAMGQAKYAAEQYGATLEETLSLQADLAAVGYSGMELQKATNEVQRIATLGELDHQQALDLTITLMSTYDQKAGDLAKTFNYMNAVENATSLSTQDFADGAVRAGGALSNLGVSVEEMGVLLVAMKEGGVDATEGANALKSATTRLLHPTKDAVNQYRAMNVNLEQITANSGGNLLEILKQLGEETASYGNVQRQQAIAALFGTYQFNRLNVAMDNVSQGYVEYAKATEMGIAPTDQSAKAIAAMYDAMGGGTDQAVLAARELARFQNSLSGRFQIALQSIRVEFAEMGKPILTVATALLEFTNVILKAFNSLPDWAKNTSVAIVAFLGIMGPMVMLAGLVMNVIGNFQKLKASIGGLITGVKVVTAEEQAAKLAADVWTDAMQKQTANTNIFRDSIQDLTESLQLLHKQQMQDMGLDPATGLPPVAPQTGPYKDPKTGRFAKRPVVSSARRSGIMDSVVDATAVDNAAKVASSMDDVEESAGQTGKHVGGFMTRLAGVGMAAWMFHDIADSSSSVLENVLQTVILFGSMNIGFKGLGSKMKGMWGNLAGASPFAKMGGGMKEVGKTVLKFLAGPGGRLLGWAGAVGLAAGAFVKIRAEMTKLQSQQEEINKSTDYWSKTLGYTLNQQKTLADGTIVNQRAAELEATAAFRKENEALADQLTKAANEGERAGGEYTKLMRLATTEAIKVVNTGGTAEQAKQALHMSLLASGIDEQEMDKLELKFKDVNLSDPETLAQMIKDQVQQILNNLEDGDGNTAGYEPGGLGGWLQKKLFGGDMTDAGRAAIANAAKVVGDAMANADDWDGNTMAWDFVGNLESAMSDQFEFAIGNLPPEQKKILDDYGIKTADQLYEAYNNAFASHREDGVWKFNDNSPLAQLLRSDTEGMAQFADTYGEGVDIALDNMGKALGYSANDIAEWKKEGWGVTEVLKQIGYGSESVASATKGYEKDIAMLGSSYNNLTDEQKLDILNMWRIRAGLPQTTNLMDGMARSVEDAAAAARLARYELTQLANISLDDLSADEYVGMIKNTYSKAQADALGLADEIMQRQKDAEMEGYRKSGDRRKDALEKRIKDTEDAYDREEELLDARIDAELDAFDALWDAKEKALDDQKKATENYYDGLIDGVEREIDAIEKADELRQKLFEREKNRLSRLAQMYNNNVDFNAALNSGNIDEAAKIYSTNMSQVQQWKLDDQDAELGDASKSQIDGLRGQIDGLNDARDAALDAIDAQKDALADLRDHELDMLKDRQDALKDDLAKRKQIALDLLNAQKDAIDRDVANNVAAAERRWQNRQFSLNLELDAIKASTPRNKAEYDTQVAQIEEAYRKHGVNVQVAGDGWHKKLGESLVSRTNEASIAVRDNIAWADMGNVIQQRISDGVGVKATHLAHWLQTGRWPIAFTGPIAAGQARPWIDPQTGQIVRHSGGEVTWSQKDRVGVPRSHSLYPSEVPTVLKQGEYVVNANASRKNRDALDAMNAGKMPNISMPPTTAFHHSGGFAEGGPAGGITLLMMSMSAMLGKMMEIGMQQRAMQTMGGSGMMGGGNPGTGKFTTTNKKWPKAIQGVVSSNTAAAVNFVKKQWPAIKSVGTLGSRPNKSDHPMGKALDVMIPNYKSAQGIALGNEIASYFIANPNAFGTNYVIWRDRIADDDNRGWRKYTHPNGPNNDDTLQHRNHVHTSLYHQGGLVKGTNLPQLRTGGGVKYDNTLANLHKGETVLTNPLTKSMKDLIENGTNVQYNVAVDLRGALVREDVDIERAIQKAIDKANAKNGRKRVIT